MLQATVSATKVSADPEDYLDLASNTAKGMSQPGEFPDFEGEAFLALTKVCRRIEPDFTEDQTRAFIHSGIQQHLLKLRRKQIWETDAGIRVPEWVCKYLTRVYRWMKANKYKEFPPFEVARGLLTPNNKYRFDLKLYKQIRAHFNWVKGRQYQMVDSQVQERLIFDHRTLRAAEDPTLMVMVEDEFAHKTVAEMDIEDWIQ